jgi:hypothetical protein
VLMKKELFGAVILTILFVSIVAMANVEGSTFQGWQIEGSGSTSESNGVTRLSASGGAWVILYEAITPESDFSFSLQVNAATLQGFSIMLRSSLPFAGSTQGVNLEFGARDGGTVLLARSVGDWTWNVFATNIKQNVWYTLKLSVQKSPFTIRAEAFDENGVLLGSFSASDMSNLNFGNIRYLGFGALESGGDYSVRSISYSETEPISDNDLVGYWKMDEGSGLTTNDDSGNGNTGVLLGSPQWVDGLHGKALDFDGVDNYVSIPDSSSLRVQSFSLIAWVYMTERPYQQGSRHSAIINKLHFQIGGFGNKGYKLQFESPTSTDDNLVVSIGDGSNQILLVEYNSINDLTLNQWHQVAGTWNGSIASIYIDGSLKNSSSTAQYMIAHDSTPLALGTEVTSGAKDVWFKGIIDEAMVYDKALSAQEMADLYTGKLPSLMPTNLEVSCKSTTSYSGFKVNIEGRLTAIEQPISNVGILLSYSVTGGLSWNDLSFVNTDENGAFSAVWMPSVTGNFLIKAIWTGNSTFSKASEVVSFAVTPFEEQSVFSVTSNSTISALFFNSTSRKLSFEATGDSGTTGYVKAYIPKSLVGDISSLKVRVDSSVANYDSESYEDGWLIYFTFSHSSHQVTIDLGAAETHAGQDIIDNYWIYAVLLSIIIVLAITIVILLKKRNKG